MRQVMQPELERRGVDRKCCKPIRHQLVEFLIVEKDEVRAFVNDTAELMLRRSNDNDRDEGHRDVPPPAEARRGDEAIAPDRAGDRGDDHQIYAPDVDEIRIVISLFQLANGVAAAHAFGARRSFAG